MRQRRTLTLIAVTTAALIGTALIVAQPAQAATAAFTRASSWSTGYEARFAVTNNTSASISSWTVQFDLPAGTSISSFWDTNIVTSGQHVTATNKTYNRSLGAGSAPSLGFITAGTGDPTNCTINGTTCAGGTGPSPTATQTTAPGTPGVPGNFRVTSTTNTSVALAWNASSC